MMYELCMSMKYSGGQRALFVDVLSLMKYSVGSVLIWHIVVNFGVYLNGHDGSSLAQTYLLAIPFDLRLMMSTVFFSLLFHSAWATKEYFISSAEKA